MRLTEIAISGFRGFRAEARLPLAPGFNVVDGRNGVGKSTIFDAVEFALTGQLTKYGDSKAAGETIKTISGGRAMARRRPRASLRQPSSATMDH